MPTGPFLSSDHDRATNHVPSPPDEPTECSLCGYDLATTGMQYNADWTQAICDRCAEDVGARGGHWRDVGELMRGRCGWGLSGQGG